MSITMYATYFCLIKKRGIRKRVLNKVIGKIKVRTPALAHITISPVSDSGEPN
jgi:hypothetical protein